MAAPKNFIKNLLFLSTTDTVNNSTGSVVIFGGISVQKNANILGNLTVSNIQSTGLTTGNINFTGNLYQNGTSYIGSQWTGTSGTLFYGSGGNTFVGINTTNPSSTLEVNGNIKSIGITTGNINFTGNLYQNGSPYIGSQWTGTSGTLFYGSGGNTFVGINTTNPTSTLTVAGDLFVSGNTTLGNFYLNNFSSGSLATNVVNIGSTSYLFAAAATAGNNTITPTIVSGLIFPIATTRSFVVVVSASTLCSVNPNYFTQYTIEGIQTDSGWVINDYIVGDQAIITFSINSTGQLLYTSTNVINWTSTTLRYKATGYFINSTSLPPNITTSGNFNINSLTVTNTTDTNSITSGSVIINGGLGISKNINIGGGGTFGGALIPNTNITYDLGSSTNRWRTLFLSGTTIDLGGTLISATSGTIAFGSTILTTTTTGNLASSIQNLVSTTSTIGSLTSTNILATNVSYSNASGLTATIPNVVHTNISTGALSGTNISTINISYGNASGLTATIPNVVNTNLTTGSINAVGITSTNILVTNVSYNNMLGLTATISNVFSTNITSTNLVSSFTSLGNLTSSTGTFANKVGGSQTVGTIVVTTSASLIGNTNTIGNLFTTGGNVGINTTSPSATLDIAGSLRANTLNSTNFSPAHTLINTGINYPSVLSLLTPNITIGNFNTTFFGQSLSNGNSGQFSFLYNGNNNTGNSLSLAFYGGAGSQIYLNNNGNIGINTTSPSNTLDVNGTSRITGTLNLNSGFTVNSNTASNVLNNSPLYIAADTNHYIRYANATNFNFANLGLDGPVIAGFGNVCLGTTGAGGQKAALIVRDNQQVGIGGISPSYTLDVNGSINLNKGLTLNNKLLVLYDGNINDNITSGFNFHGFGVNSGTLRYQVNLASETHRFYCGSTSYYTITSSGGANVSDKRYKSEIINIENAIDKIKQLQGITFKMENIEKRQMGFLAQDVKIVIPEVVQVSNTETEKDLHYLSYDKLVPLLTEGIKEQQKMIDKLIDRIEKLENVNKQ